MSKLTIQQQLREYIDDSVSHRAADYIDKLEQERTQGIADLGKYMQGVVDLESRLAARTNNLKLASAEVERLEAKHGSAVANLEAAIVAYDEEAAKSDSLALRLAAVRELCDIAKGQSFNGWLTEKQVRAALDGGKCPKGCKHDDHN